MLEPVGVSCPYCGEPLELLADASAGDQQYIEDCQVCCQPMIVYVAIDSEGQPSVETFREDDTI